MLTYGPFAPYLMQANFYSEGRLTILYHGLAWGSLMGMRVGISAPSCPWGYAHPRDGPH